MGVSSNALWRKLIIQSHSPSVRSGLMSRAAIKTTTEKPQLGWIQLYQNHRSGTSVRSKPMARWLHDLLLYCGSVKGTVILHNMAMLFTIIQTKMCLIGSICHAEDNSTKRNCTSLPPGRTRSRNEERERDEEMEKELLKKVEEHVGKVRSESESKRNTKLDQSAASTDTGDASVARMCHADRQWEQG